MLDLDLAEKEQMRWQADGKPGHCPEWLAYEQKGFVHRPRRRIPEVLAPEVRKDEVLTPPKPEPKEQMFEETPERKKPRPVR